MSYQELESTTREQIVAAEEEVRELLRKAGPREAIPPKDLAAIKSAARREWQEMVLVEEKQRLWSLRRAGLALAASLLVALLVGWLWSRQGVSLAPIVVATVDVLEGEMRLIGKHGGVYLEVGSGLPEGARLETVERGGAPSRAALRMTGGESVRLDTGSRIQLTSSRRVELERGAVYVDSGGNAPTHGFEIGTAFGTVTDIGTQFEVRLIETEAALRIRVREGAVNLESGPEPYSVEAGQELTFHGPGFGVVVPIESYGPEWGWVVATAPRLGDGEIPIQEYLDWVTREMGLLYPDDGAAAAELRIDTVTGSGDAAPNESLENVLRAYGLGYRIEDGTLFLTAPSGD
ncbi:MAG: FecR family protein [Thermoanaerobaculia bacterium]